jgi:carbamate kinase
MSKSELKNGAEAKEFEYIKKGREIPKGRTVPKTACAARVGDDKLACEKGIVIAAGGGGIPMTLKAGKYHGVDAVVDKDLTSAILAHDMGADILVILTDTNYLYSNEAGGSAIKQIKVRSSLQGMMESLEEGTIKAKGAGLHRLRKKGGKAAYIGNLYKLREILNGRSGTKITK